MEWLRTVYNWSRNRQLLEDSCALCGSSSRPIGGADPTTAAPPGLCAGCRSDLPTLGPACALCAMPLPLGGICGHCQRRPPPYRATCAFRYDSPLSELLIDLKFHGRLGIARTLGELLAERLAAAQVARPEVIIPVPLHPERLRERGYNQALELARPVAARFGQPLAPGLGRRVRATATQSNLDLAQRRRNMRAAFAVQGAVPESVAILDDVVTTGSTVAAFANALRRAGAQEIQVWAVARAVR